MDVVGLGLCVCFQTLSLYIYILGRGDFGVNVFDYSEEKVCFVCYPN